MIQRRVGLPSTVMSPAPSLAGTISAFFPREDSVVGAWRGDLLFAALSSSAALSRTINRFPASSQV